MAKKKGSEYENALSSIFDFIFKNANKPDKPLKPKRPSGTSDMDNLANGLATVAAAPAALANSSIMDGITSGLLDPKIVEFWIDKIDTKQYIGLDDANGRVRVKVKDIPAFLKNPHSFIQKAYKDAAAERKWATASKIGAGIDGAIALLWGKKQGMGWAEAMDFAQAAGYTVTDGMIASAHRMAEETAAYSNFKGNKARGEQAGKDLHSAFNQTALTRGGRYFANYGDNFFTGSQTEYKAHLTGKLNDEQKRLLDTGGRGLAPKDRKTYDVLVKDLENKIKNDYPALRGRTDQIKSFLRDKRYTDEEINGMLDSYKGALNPSGIVSETWWKNVDPMSYRRIYMNNMAARAGLLDPTRDRDELTKIQMKQSAAVLWQRIYGGDKLEFGKLIKQLQEARDASTHADVKRAFDSQIRRVSKAQERFEGWEKGEGTKFLNTWGFSGVGGLKYTREALEHDIQSQILIQNSKLIEIEEKQLRGEITVTDAERQKNDVMRQLKVLGFEQSSLRGIPGTNFRIRFGQAVGLYRYITNSKGIGRDIVNGNFFNGLIHPIAPGLPQDLTLFTRDGKVTSKRVLQARPDVNPAWGIWTNAYYLSPTVWVRTLLWNGEGFSYLAGLRQQRMLHLLGQKDVLEMLKRVSGDSTLTRENLGGKLFEVMDALRGSGDPHARRIFGMLQKHEAAMKRFSRVIKFYNGITERFTNFWGGLQKKGRELIGRALRGKIKNAVWNKAVDAFILGEAGLKQLIKAAITAALQALSVETAGLSLVISLVAGLIADAIFAAAKPILEILMFAVWGCLGLLLLLIMLVFMPFFSIFNVSSPFSQVAPNTCEECMDNNPHSGLYPEPPIDLPGEEYPPSDSLCPITYSDPIVCNQGSGPQGHVSDYHFKTKAIDVRVRDVVEGDDAWYAPTDGYILSYEPSKMCADGKDYGGTLKFVDSAGNIYIMLHIRALKSQGNVTKGQALAITRRDLEESECWTGPHHHLEVLSNGSYQDAHDWYVNKLQCNILPCP